MIFKEMDKVIKEFFDYVEELFPEKEGEVSVDTDGAYVEVGYNPFTGCYDDDL